MSGWWRVTVNLEEPFCCSARPAVSNELQTTDYLPATSLRGGLAAELARNGRGDELGLWFGLGGPLFSNALPVLEDVPLIPMPLCLMRDKYDNGDFDGAFGVYNTLTRPIDELPRRTGPHRHQWSRLKCPWLQVDAHGKIVGSTDIDYETAMHVGLHYGRQSVRGPALYSRSKIVPGTRFATWVWDANGVIKNPPKRLFLGKRRSAGNGAASLTWESGRWPWIIGTVPQPCVIQLVSDAILPCPDRGGFRLGLTDSDLQPIFGSEVKIKETCAATDSVGGWSSRWGLPRERAITVRAGSAYVLENASQTPAVPTLGLRSNEGFGWLAVHPTWLCQAGKAAILTWNQPRSGPKPDAPSSWPGVHLEPKQMLEIEALLRPQISDFKNHRARLAFLSSVANRVTEVPQWQNVINGYAGSKNAKEWQALRKQIESLNVQDSIHRLRWALEVLTGLTAKERQ